MPRVKAADYRRGLVGSMVHRWDSYANEIVVIYVHGYDDGQKYAVYHESEGRGHVSDLEPRHRVDRSDQVVSRGQWCVVPRFQCSVVRRPSVADAGGLLPSAPP